MINAVGLQIAFLVGASSAPANCSYDPAKAIAMSFESFDQESNGGWRELEARGCQIAAAQLINVYRHEHKALQEAERSLLSWHEGQMRAIGGDYKSAIPLLMGGVPEGNTVDFVDYALGTVAFLQRDKPGLIAARARLVSVPKPASFAGTFTITSGGKSEQVHIKWPVNLDILDGLIQCYDKPYKIAYNCRP